MSEAMEPMSMATISFGDETDDLGITWYWLDLVVDGQQFDSIPFDTADERARARDDLVNMALQVGSRELPLDASKLS